MNHKFVSFSAFIKNSANPVYLHDKIWKENSTALLHAPRQTDKATLAFDIALKLTSSGRKVAYVNTEHHAEDNVSRIGKADNLFIFTPAYESPDDHTDYADLVIAGIEEAVATSDIRTFVIDSVSRIAALSFGRNASQAYVMKRLVALQIRCRLSLLVISHDSTRSADGALLNLADSEIIPAPPAEKDDTATKTHDSTAAPDSLSSGSPHCRFSRLAPPKSPHSLPD